MEYESSSVKLTKDDMLFFFTDGLSEAMDQDECRIQRGADWTVSSATEPRLPTGGNYRTLIMLDVQKHDPSVPPKDDTTIIALKMNGLNGHQ